jgi:hypothetical protein
VSDKPTGRVIWTVIGAVAGALIGAWVTAAFVLLVSPLHIRIGMNHGLFLLLLIGVPIALGIVAGLLFADGLSRRNWSQRLLVLWRRYWNGSLFFDRFRAPRD